MSFEENPAPSEEAREQKFSGVSDKESRRGIEEFDEAIERRLTDISRKLSSQIIGAIKTIQPVLLDPSVARIDKIRTFVSTLKTAFPLHRSPNRMKPEFELSAIDPSCTDVNFYFEPNRDGGELASFAVHEKRTMAFGIQPLLNATSVEQVEDALEVLATMIYHETEHFEYWGTDLVAEDGKDGAVRYLASPGEIRANAKQSAFRFLKHFPGEAFDLEKMRSILTAVNEKNYFVGFAKTEVQEKYRHVIDLAEVHRQMVHWTTKLVDFMRQNS